MQEKEQKISPTKERILQFADTLGISKREFYKIIDVSRGTLESKTGITEDTLAKFIAIYPQVNIEWLMTGRGDALKSQTIQINETEPQMSVYKLRTDYYGVERQQIPLYEIEASAGLSTLLSPDIKQIPLDYITVPNAPKCDGAVFVRGDSMYPVLKAGDIVCYKTIHNIDNIYFGEMYLIDVDVEGDQYLTFKYVQKSSKGDDYVCLASHNDHHASKDILKSSIRSIAIVKLSIRYNTVS
jgi:phage repressor protein C with HTH and peptisase S24 domain